MNSNNKTLEVVKDNLNTYAVIKINWNFSSLSDDAFRKVSYLNHNSDNLFNNKESAEMVCNALNDKSPEDITFMVIEIPPKK